MRFFRLFSKTTLTILLIFGQNVEMNVLNHHAKFHAEKKFPAGIFILKDRIFSEKG